MSINPYGTTQCIGDTETEKRNINFLYNRYINKNPNDKSNADFLLTRAIRSLNINNTNIDYILNKLSCNNYCELTGDATFNSLSKCQCKNSSNILKETSNTFLDANTNKNISINTAKCIPPLQNFQYELDGFNKNFNTLVGNIPTPVSITFSCGNVPCPTKANII